MLKLPTPTAAVKPVTPDITRSDLLDALRALRAGLRPGRRGSFTPQAEARLHDVHLAIHRVLRDTPLAFLLSRYAPETADNLYRWTRSAAAREFEGVAA